MTERTPLELRHETYQYFLSQAMRLRPLMEQAAREGALRSWDDRRKQFYAAERRARLEKLEIDRIERALKPLDSALPAPSEPWRDGLDVPPEPREDWEGDVDENGLR